MSEWNKVTDGLPDTPNDRGEYFFTFAESEGIVAMNEFWDGRFCFGNKAITHWMQIDLPKEP